MKKFLNKLQKLSDWKKKTILWLFVIVIAFFLLKIYIKSFQARMENIKKEDIGKELHLPELQEELKNLPNFEIPTNK
jgi:flagellar biosynthesis/type III secretory pathway M-ring protein FliF/YscJ